MHQTQIKIKKKLSSSGSYDSEEGEEETPTESDVITEQQMIKKKPKEAPYFNPGGNYSKRESPPAKKVKISTVNSETVTESKASF